MVQNNQIKLPDALTIKDTRNIYAQVFKLEALILQTQPLHQTIYTFRYLTLDSAISMMTKYGRTHY